MRRSTWTRFVLATAALAPVPALAHSFGRAYTLPVPFWLYAWGAAGALVASFVVLAYFVTARPDTPTRRPLRETGIPLPAWLLGTLRLAALTALGLCVATGWFGTKSPYGNFSMTFFWIVFVLGFAYLTALIGDLYAWINPWRVLATAIGRVMPAYLRGRIGYPGKLGYWPATALYVAFIWIELFGRTTPHALATLLVAYTLLNLIGVGLIGVRDWFRYCELFSVFFRLIALMAPLAFVADRAAVSRPVLRSRPPFAGVVDARAEGFGMLVFVLFMLSSTAFDGLRDTAIWHRLFWLDLYRALLQDWVGRNPLAAFPTMRMWFGYWQTFWLLASPLLYLGLYLLFVDVQRRIANVSLSTRELALRFAPTLLPIALVYNITHYYTLIQTQGVKILSLASDPFGRGWDLFGTASWFRYAIIPDPKVVWHVQVVLIVIGHIVSVVLAHRLALRLCASRRDAVVSQLPMLALMLLFTTGGLWILSQPLAGID